MLPKLKDRILNLDGNEVDIVKEIDILMKELLDDMTKITETLDFSKHIKFPKQTSKLRRATHT